MSKPTLKEIFYHLQEQMISQLSTDRELLFHAPTKGSASEVNWITWLKEYLPKRYSVDQAFVVDSNGDYSDQIDVVIYDRQYSPFVFNQDGALYIPAESVYAVFEIKQDLDKTNFDYAKAKVRTVRQLHRTSAPVVHAGGVIGTPKPPLDILGGILTLSSSWSTAFGQPFQDCVSSSDELDRLDIGCILRKGGFKIDYPAAGMDLQVSSADEALIFFFLKLLMSLQSLGTVPAMDINEYAQSLDSI